jgi:hypothetical protein
MAFLHAAAQREVLAAERLDVAGEAEGAGAAHLAQIRGRREVDRRVLYLTLDVGVLELDVEIDAEAVVGCELGPAVAALDAHGAPHAHEVLGLLLLLDARRLEQEHEGAGAAVHDRDFAAAEIDTGIVDAEPGERRT